MKQWEWPLLMLRRVGDRTDRDDITEAPEEYAQRRANETGHPYIISNMGHVLMDCHTNRTMLRNLRCHVICKVDRIYESPKISA